MRKVLVAAGLFALAVAPVAVNAQSINVDFQGATNSGIPANTYGAAGSPGFWNVITSTGAIPVMGLAGNPTGVTVSSSAALSFNFNNVGTLGDDQALLDDLFDLGGPGSTTTLSVAGLTPGNYQVITYAWAPDSGTFFTNVTVPGAAQGQQSVGGPWGSAPALGVTHALHTINVGAAGTLSVNATTGPAVGTFGSLNGLQLVIPEPATLSLLGLGSFALIRRRR